jgi:hypothetical protein
MRRRVTGIGEEALVGEGGEECEEVLAFFGSEREALDEGALTRVQAAVALP